MDARPEIFRTAFHEIAFCITIFCAQLFTQASLGNVLVVLHIISKDLGISQNTEVSPQLPWFVASYSLTVGIFILITGRLGDVYGHKRLFVIGFLWYGVCTLILGFAYYTHNAVFFIIWRALQGIGPSTVLPNGVALLAHAYPNGPRKTLVFALFGATAPSGFVIGAIFSSLFAQLVWWPWAQWVMAIFCFIIAIIGQLWVVPDEIGGANSPDGKIDWAGAATIVIGLIMFVYAWNEAPIVGWDKPYVFIFLIIGVFLIAFFIFIEGRVTEPIMPLDIWSKPGFPGVIASVGLGWSSFGIFLFYIIQMFEVFRGATPLLATAQFSPVVVSGLAATMTMAALHGKVPGHYLLSIALLAFCAGNILVELCPVDSTYWGFLFVAVCITPFGMDISYPAGSLIVSNALPKERQGVGASMINTVVNLSVSLGLGIAGTVESQEDSNGNDPLHGQRAASYCGIALSGIGFLVAFFLCRVEEHQQEKSPSSKQKKEPALPTPTPKPDSPTSVPMIEKTSDLQLPNPDEVLKSAPEQEMVIIPIINEERVQRDGTSPQDTSPQEITQATPQQLSSAEV